MNQNRDTGCILYGFHSPVTMQSIMVAAAGMRRPGGGVVLHVNLPVPSIFVFLLSFGLFVERCIPP